MVLNKKGAQGIGTLIIFIAMILVAAVAAGVLIQTASSLQSKALDVGRQSQERITTDIEIVQVFAENTNNSEISVDDTVTMVVRLGSGSEDVKLSDLIVKMDTQTGSQTLSYNNSAATQSNYNITTIAGGTKVPYLEVGELAQIRFKNEKAIGEAEQATIRLVSKNGAVKPVAITTPSAMIDSITYLYP